MAEEKEGSGGRLDLRQEDHRSLGGKYNTYI